MTSKVFLVLAVCLCAVAIQSVRVSELSDEQIRKLFHRERNEIPSYEFATLIESSDDSHRSKRETRPVEFEVEGRKVQLNLRPIRHEALSNYIPVWTVETDRNKPSGHSYHKVPQDVSKIDGVFYQDPEKFATMLAYYKDKYIYYDGIFGESSMSKIVRSVPEKWWKLGGTDLGDDYVVYGVDEDTGTTKPIENDDQFRGELLEKPLDILYPKLLLILDHSYFKILGEDVNEALRYVATFWNAVNLKYSKLTNPSVKIVITGVIIAKDDTALRYVYDNRNSTNMDQLNSNKLLLDGDKYFRKEFPSEVDFKNYDSTITMTSLNTGIIAGSAYLAKICSDYNNIGFVRDDGSFSGLQPGVHELGHLLSLNHDGNGKDGTCDSYPNENTSTIMAPFVASVEKYIWSECSKDTIRKFAASKAAECMKYPHRR